MDTNAYRQFEQFSNLDLTVLEQTDEYVCYKHDQDRLFLFNCSSGLIETYNHLDFVGSLTKMIGLELPDILDSGHIDGLYFLLASSVEHPGNGSVDDCDLKTLALDLAGFFKQLKSVAGQVGLFGNFKNVEFSTKIESLRKTIAEQPCGNDQVVYTDILNQGLESIDEIHPALIYGNIGCANLVIRNGRLIGIDQMATPCYGDEAFSYALGYHCLDKDSRAVFFKELGCDEGTKKRARNWALYQALGASSSDDPAALKTLYHIFEEYYS